jgi:hypothetical protein
LLRSHTNLDDVDSGGAKICKLERKNKVRTEKKGVGEKKRTQKKCQGRKKGRGKVAEIEKQQERKMEVKYLN